MDLKRFVLVSAKTCTSTENNFTRVHRIVTVLPL